MGRRRVFRSVVVNAELDGVKDDPDLSDLLQLFLPLCLLSWVEIWGPVQCFYESPLQWGLALTDPYLAPVDEYMVSTSPVVKSVPDCLVGESQCTAPIACGAVVARLKGDLKVAVIKIDTYQSLYREGRSGNSQEAAIISRRMSKIGVVVQKLAECLLHFPLLGVHWDVFDPNVHGAII